MAGYPASRLICSPVNGLCNRLKAMESCLEFAKATKRKFELKWYPEKKCNILFEDLFEYTDLLPQADFNFDFEDLREFGKKHHVLYSDDCVYFQYDASGYENSKINLLKECSLRNLIILNGGNLCYHGNGIEQVAANKFSFYSNLVIKKEIISKIDQFWSKYSNKNILGVQLRTTDHCRRKEYSPLFKTQYNEVIKKTLDNAVAYIDIITDDYDYIYLTTDDLNLYDAFSDKLKNLIYYPKTEISRTTKEGMIGGLIDWYLLGKCDNILYSPGSTFGSEACVRKGIKGIKMSDIYNIE